MIKNLVLTKLKKIIVPAIIAFIILTVFSFLEINSSSTLIQYLQDGGTGFRTYYERSTFIQTFGIISSIIFFIAPLLIYTFRWNTQKTDFYYQVSTNRKTFTRVNIVTVLVATFSLVTVSYWILVAWYAIKCATVSIPAPYYQYYNQNNDYYLIVSERVYLQIDGLFYAYLFLMLSGISLFGIGTFVSSLTNNFISSLILIVCTYFVLTFLQLSVNTLLLDIEKGYLNVASESYGYGGIEFSLLLSRQLDHYIVGLREEPFIDIFRSTKLFMDQYSYMGQIWHMIAVTSLIGSAGLLHAIFCKGRSAEYAAKPYTDSFVDEIIFHLSFTVLFFLFTFVLFENSNPFIALAVGLFVMIVYYLTNSLRRKSFKLKIIDLYTTLPNVAVYIVMIVLIMVTNLPRFVS